LVVVREPTERQNILEGRVNYDALEQDLHDSDESARLGAVRRIVAVPLFEEGQVVRFLKALKDTLNDPSIAVRYYAKKAFARLKRMVRNRDLGIILPEDLENALGKDPPPAPTFVYGSRDYWLYELNSPDYKLRIKAAIELSKEPDEESYRRLCELAKKETHDHVLATLAKYLCFYRRSDVFFQVKDFLHHPDARVRANSIEGFQILGDPRAVPLIKPFLKDPDNRIRANAAKFLVMFHPEEVLRNIKEMLASSSEWMKDSALFLLTKVEVPGVEVLLLEALKDTSDEVLEKAVLGLGTNGTTQLAQEALTRIQANQDPSGSGERPFSDRVKAAATGALELFKRRLESRRAAR
jgi:HEAT repeat protein